MSPQKSAFPFYKEINDFLESITSLRSDNPNFYCFRFKSKINQTLYKPPYRKAFFSILLVSRSEEYDIQVNRKGINPYSSFIIMQAPGQLMSYKYKVSPKSQGLLILFKPELFSFLKNSFLKEFNYLEILQTEVLKISEEQLQKLETDFEDLFSEYEQNQKVAALKLLILFYTLNDFFKENEKQYKEKLLNEKGGEAIFQKFLQLVNIYYLEKKSIKEYANALNISPNYLSKQIKTYSDKSALSFINDRITDEAKSLILYTDYNVNQIAQQLGYTDSSNFVKFFKKQTGQTPADFKKNKNK